ncbi:unnamed protein product [Tilletia controversa]|nr:unnamed protein product [Tilletia controversa]
MQVAMHPIGAITSDRNGTKYLPSPFKLPGFGGSTSSRSKFSLWIFASKASIVLALDGDGTPFKSHSG